MLSLEKQLLANAASLQTERANNHTVRQGKIVTPDYFSEEQREALGHIIASGDIKCVIGYAGSGKSTILNSAREAWERERYQVHGVTLSGIAAENLTGASGISSRTVASRLYYWDKGEQKLTDRDILVVDEAGMLGSRQMSRLLEEAHESGAKVVLIGDPQQLQAIEAGAAFRAIAEQTSYVELTQIRRQHEKWQQEATKEFAQGEVEKALNRYDQHDHLHEFDTQAHAKQSLVEMWNDTRINNPEKTQIILAYTRKDVQELNEMARELRSANKELGQDHLIKTERGDRQFAEGDRIYFLKNERSLGVMNGTLGTVEKVENNHVTVRLDKDLENTNNRTIAVDTNFYNHLDHGYAATIHKAQGVTVDRSYVLASKYMDSHASYVALSRHRESTDLFWGKDEFAHQRDLTQSLGRDRSKDVSLDYGVEVIDIPQHKEFIELEKQKEAEQTVAEQRERPLTSAEIKERYKDPLQAFKAKYEAQNPEQARKIQDSLQPAFERKAIAAEKEFQLLERAIKESHTPKTYQQQLERYAGKIAKDRDVMGCLSGRNPALAAEITEIAKQREHKKELALERSFGRDRGGGRSW